MSVPITSSETRVWLIDGRARPDHDTEFLNFLKFTGIDQSFGAVTPIHNPSRVQYQRFIQVGEFRDAEDRPSTSLVGHFDQRDKSRLLTLAQSGCKFDTQMHIGLCEDPGIFNDFLKAIIWESVLLESFSTDELGALEPGEQGKVDETGDISAQRMYEFVPLALAARDPELVYNELLDVIICDAPSCGDCETESTGCQRIMAISQAAGGSPTTPADVVFSLDGGLTWFSDDIDTLDVAVNPNAIACVGSYVVVVVNSVGEEMHIALISEFDGVTDPAFIQQTTGYVAGRGPNDIWSLGSTAYICADFGYIYKTTDPAAGVTVVDAGAATVAILHAIHMLSEEFGVTVGQDGAIVRIQSDLAALMAVTPVGIGVDLQAVWVKSETEWFVGSNAGGFYFTLNGGATWTAITLPGTAPSAITGIEMSSDSVMYVSATVDGKGEIFVSIDGGRSFIRSPRNQANAMPNNDRINAIAACIHDVDFIAGVGLASDSTDGFIVIGSD